MRQTRRLPRSTGHRIDISTRRCAEIYPAPAFTNYGKKLLKNDFNGEEGFTLDGGIKDAACASLTLVERATGGS